MLLDASSHVEFAKAVMDRACCCGNHYGEFNRSFIFARRKNEIKQLLSDFEWLVSAAPIYPFFSVLMVQCMYRVRTEHLARQR